MKDRIVDAVWRGKDPFAGFPTNLYEHDTQGWFSGHPYLTDEMEKLVPAPLIVEIGVWKGGSVLTMARRIRDLKIDGVVIGVDTWLGAWDHWINDEWFPHLAIGQGRPMMQAKFMNNVIREDLVDYIVPFPLDSVNAAQVLRARGVSPNMIHLDGGHDYEAVMTDLKCWWPLLADGGYFIGDDYQDAWPGVQRACDEFFGALSLPFDVLDNKIKVLKPGGAADDRLRNL
jgi:hypothetical protein